jgi:hypothetical protein
MSYLFRRIAGAFQVSLESFDDLVDLARVPDAHWVATAAPIASLRCDPVVLAALDTDANGRVRAAELKAAIAWTASMLADTSDCVPGSDVLVVAHLSEPAAPLASAAALVLDTLAAPDRTRISLAQVREVRALLNQRAANGDGVVPATAVEDPRLQGLAADILACLPGVIDVSGQPGLDVATVDAFGTACDHALGWFAAGADAEPWGPGSLAMARAVRALQPKLDEYFLLCRLVASQPGTADAFHLSPERAATMLGDPAAIRAALDLLPLAPPDPSGVLGWDEVYRTPRAEAVHALREQVVRPALGEAEATLLTEAGWTRLVATADAVLAWADAETTHPVTRLGAARLATIRPAELEALRALCEADAAVAGPIAQVEALERLVLYQRWLFELANNFVAMPNLYRRTRAALFEEGTLVLAGRNFALSMLVADRSAHSTLATQSSMFLLYVNVHGHGRSFEVCVPVTSGSSDGLYVGKRGIFHSVDGAEYDATVVSLIANPVSIWEAIIQPFQRVGRMIGSRLEKWQAAADADFEKHLTVTADATQARVTAPAAPSKPMDAAAVAGVAAASGLAFAAIGSTVAGLAGFLGGDGIVDTLLRILGLLGLIASPFAVVAWWKLRRRNIAGLLEASGWALNNRLKLSRKLGYLFTRRPARPHGSRLDWHDETVTMRLADLVPDEEVDFGTRVRRVLWALLCTIVLAAVVLNATGYLDDVFALVGIRLPGTAVEESMTPATTVP